ncbi:MAG: hypothetical protein J1E40_00630 [Oscillospiraceae bacterium]|nr:hypothetical protein [Oscillospiraceae bacterium]
MRIFELIIALILNLLLVLMEGATFLKVKNKLNILKFYTFLQNFIALAISVLFCGFAIRELLGFGKVPVLIKGLRYTATCGLAATMFVFAFFLAPRFKSGKSKSHTDLFGGLEPKKANLLLHYICPIISIISFLLFERGTVLTNSEWTGYAAIPSCTYWVIYIFLTVTHLWKEPYGLTASRTEKKNHLVGILLLIAIPTLFILLSYVLYWLNQI